MPSDPDLGNMPEKKKRLLLAAVDVFSEQGFHSATIDQIAERAGVGKGTVYLYFQSKQDLFLGIIQEGLGWLAAGAASLAAAHADPRERLRQLVHWHLRIVLRNYPRMRMFVSGGVPHDLQVILPEFQRQMQAYRSLYMGALQDGVSAGYFRPHDSLLLAVGLLGCLSQVGRYLAEESTTPDLDASVEQLLQFILSGVEKARN